MREYNEALDAMRPVSQWLAFRYLFAKQYNKHNPQKNQHYTKKLSAQIAGEIIEGMGGAIMSLPPPGLDDDEEWSTFIEAAGKVELDMQTCLMRQLVRDMWSDDAHWKSQMERLALVMTHMRREQRSNNAGWIAGVGFRKRKRRKKRKKR